MTNLNTALRDARQLEGVTMKHAAAKLKISVAQLSRLETGICSPTLKTFVLMCELYKETPNSILGWWQQ
jgi:transcriptional regulator with XRE-family HTH domain